MAPEDSKSNVRVGRLESPPYHQNFNLRIPYHSLPIILMLPITSFVDFPLKNPSLDN